MCLQYKALSKQPIWGQLHQHFMQSFYAHRFQKIKNDSQVIGHFALLVSTRIKASRKHVGEIDP